MNPDLIPLHFSLFSIPDLLKVFCSRTSVILNIPFAFILLFIGYVLYNRAIEQRQLELDRQLSMFLSRLPHPDMLQSKSTEFHIQNNEGDKWKEFVGCSDLIRSWDDFAKLVTKDFVSDLFYAYMTPDSEVCASI